MEINQERPVGAAVTPDKRVDRARLMEIRSVHQEYVTGLGGLYQRIRNNEEWWRMRNGAQERKVTEIGKDGGFVAKSAWLVNVIISKDADGIEAYPEPTIQPREQTDRQTATILSSIIPCVLELNGYRRVWRATKSRKHRHGCGVSKVFWDKSKHNGLGDISVVSVNPLNLAWKPTTMDIQKSPYFFHQEYVDKDALLARYPQAAEELSAPENVPLFNPDDEQRDLRNVATVVECYYKVPVPTGVPGVSRDVLHYVVYTGGVILYASEDDPNCKNGWYEHGLYPYVFDSLFPGEDSAFGRGYIDIGKNTQTQIDLLNTAFIKNAMVGAIPRFLTQDGNSSINEGDLLDLSKPIVPVKGSISEQILREVPHKPLEGNYLNLRDSLIQELRETTGNTESSTGNTSSGVTAASAIAALQEASNKVSRAENDDSYGAFAEIVRMVIELMRQFYTAPRIFRVTGQQGQEEFQVFDNTALAAQPLTDPMGNATGLRKPEFDVIVGAQKATAYQRMAQNEMALQFYNAGFFDPARAEQAIMCLEMMDFQGKEEVLGKIQRNAQMQAMLLQFAQIAMTYAPPEVKPTIAQAIMQLSGQGGGAVAAMPQISGKEPSRVTAARDNAQNTQPQGG